MDFFLNQTITKELKKGLMSSRTKKTQIKRKQLSLKIIKLFSSTTQRDCDAVKQMYSNCRDYKGIKELEH